jgi:hypothetical protein
MNDGYVKIRGRHKYSCHGRKKSIIVNVALPLEPCPNPQNKPSPETRVYITDWKCVASTLIHINVDTPRQSFPAIVRELL